MSAEMAMRAALIAALRDAPSVGGALNGIYDGAPVQAAAPYAVIGECLGADWGTKDADGCELRIGVTLFDQGESPARLATLIDPVDRVVKAVGGPAGAGFLEDWAVASIAFVRSRILRSNGVRGSGGGWSAMLDYRVRMLRTGG